MKDAAADLRNKRLQLQQEEIDSWKEKYQQVRPSPACLVHEEGWRTWWLFARMGRGGGGGCMHA